MPRLSVVIINDNSAEYCRVLLESLQSQSIARKDVEIIFVDNCSTDQSVAVAESISPDSLHVFSERVENRALLYNQGLSLSSSEYILFVHSDVYFVSDFLSKITYIIDRQNYDFINFRLQSPDLVDHGYDNIGFNLKSGQFFHRKAYQCYPDWLSVVRCSQSCFAVRKAFLLPDAFDAEFKDSFFEYIPLLQDEINVFFCEDVSVVHYFIEQHNEIKTEEFDRAVLFRKYYDTIMKKLILAARNHQTDDQAKQLAERDYVISEQGKQIAERDYVISERGKQIAERDYVISEQGKLIAERDQRIAERDYVISEQGKQVAERDQRIAERDYVISEQGKQIAERDYVISEQGGQIAERDQRIAERDYVISEQGEQIAERDATISGLFSSNSWRITRPLRLIGGYLRRCSK